MKLTVCHYLATNTLNLRYDLKAREGLMKSSKPLVTFCRNREVHALAAPRLSDLLARFARANEILSQFIENDSGQIELSVDDMRNLLEVTLLAANYPDASGADLTTLVKSALLLATGTPYAVPSIPLPPAVEVFDRSLISPAAWAGYEVIRLWSHPSLPYLVLFDLYEVWTAFQVEPPTGNHIRIFHDWLSETTLSFRETLDLLVAAKLGPKPTREQKRK